MSDENGESLVEVLLVIVILGFIVMLLANLPNAMGLINKAKHLSLAREIASKQIEDKREISFSNLTVDETPVPLIDSRIMLLPEGSGTVFVEDCNTQLCTNNENIKQLTVTVNWRENSKQEQVKLQTFIGEGGINQ